MNATVPKSYPIKVENIPTELTELDQWAAWQWEQRGGKWTKPPLDPSTGRYARNNDPGTWGSLKAALKLMQRYRLPGIGFMFHPEDGLAGVDLDGCRNPLTAEVEPWARGIVGEFDSYTEASPTETGLKIFVSGKLPPGRRRKGSVEMYDCSRFFTTTGHRLPGVPSSIQNRQEELAALHHRVFGEPADQSTGGKKGSYRGAALGLSDTQLVDRATQAANGEKFARLWAGDTSDYKTVGNDGRSEADLAFCSILAFWVGPDEARIDRLFRQSGLMREKWERADYRALTLASALNRGEFWDGRGATTLRRDKVYAHRQGVVSVG